MTPLLEVPLVRVTVTTWLNTLSTSQVPCHLLTAQGWQIYIVFIFRMELHPASQCLQFKIPLSCCCYHLNTAKHFHVNDTDKHLMGVERQRLMMVQILRINSCHSKNCWLRLSVIPEHILCHFTALCHFTIQVFLLPYIKWAYHIDRKSPASCVSVISILHQTSVATLSAYTWRAIGSKPKIMIQKY